ncbi:DNA polymerase III subunit gamma/tau [soil metagenome]
MDKFIVSARKYRPQNFSSVVGQSHITTTLKNAIKNNQLAHAFLFCGPRGVGKTTCARILEKTINCENRTADGEACNVCNSCVSFDNGTSMNIHELDAASNNSVDDIRALADQVRFAPQAGKYKVYIVDEVHMLSTSAFNAFLKTLEEPPPFAIFILATTEKHKILPTILSRCQIFDFKRITNQDTVEHLQEICKKEKISADAAALHVIAQKSEGCLRDALSILDKIVSFTNGELTYANTLEHLNILDEDYYFRLFEAISHQQVSDTLLLFDEINRKGFEGDLLLTGFMEFIRNLLVSKDAKVVMLLEVAEGFKQRYLEAASGADAGLLLAILNVLNEAEINFRQARNKRLHVELTFIKLCYLQQAIELVGDGKQIESKKQITESKPVSFRALNITPAKKKKLAAADKEFKKPITAKKPPHEQEPEEKRSSQEGAKLIIEEPGHSFSPAAKDHTNVATKPATKLKRLRSLEKIQQQVALENKLNGNSIKELNEEELYVAWGLYIEKLKENSNHSGIATFKEARLNIIDSNCIEIVTANNLQQRFVEAERASLIDHLQSHFNNRFLTYKVQVDESSPKPLVERSLSTKEQYLKLIEEYPLIKQLKDKLGLHLDY